MTINREAAELMAVRLTNAVDAAHTFAEALRLATVALQEPREAPEVAPGTAGTATVSGKRGVRVMRVQPDDRAERVYVWISDHTVGGMFAHADEDVTAFVPDPDTAALRAEVERLNGELESERHAVETQSGQYEGLANWAKEQRDRAGTAEARADAAEARLARVSTAIAAQITSWEAENSERWAEIHTSVKVAIDAAQYAVVENLRDLLALAASDEQAAEVRRELITVPYDGHGDDVTCPDCPHSTSHHDPIACGDPSCDC